MEQNFLLLAAIVFFPMLGAGISYLAGRKDKTLRDRVAGCVTIVEFLLLILLLITKGAKEASFVLPGVCGMGLSFETEGFRAMYGAIAAFMWMAATLFSAEYFAHYRNRNRYYLFLLVTLGATEGIFFSADLYTTFVFFEVMSLASYVWVAQDEHAPSLRAAATYLAVAVIGGLVMLMGLFLLYNQAGTLTISELHDACAGKNVYVAAGCLFFGFAAKAGAFPLHIWLPKAHPVAPAPASALLSGILTKTGIFGILVISCKILLHDWKWGTFVLVLGTLTMVAGAVLALFSVDFKRTLACSSVSQIGFILVGIGMQGLLAEENALAVRGSLLHMVNHSLFKLVLFLVAGVIFMNVHKLDLNEIRGFGRKKPLLAAIYLAGALGIGGIPLFSGYISKTLLHESIVEYTEALETGALAQGVFGVSDMKIIEWLFLISGGLTVAYMCKLFFAVFVEKNNDAKVQKKYDGMSGSYMKPVSAAALAVPAALFPLMGILPHQTMDKLADMGQGFCGLAENPHTVAYFSLTNLKGSLISIAIGALIYLLLVRTWMLKKQPDGTTVYVNRWPRVLDLEDYVYRPILLTAVPAVCGGVCMVLDNAVDLLAKLLPIAGSVEAGFFDTITDSVIVFLRKTIYQDSPQPHELEEGNALTHVCGRIVNRAVALLNLTIWRRHPKKKDYEHTFALAYESFKENTGIIGRSLSYGLILFCLGLCGTLIYLLISLLL
ncbi:complex I subunit 5 family protein [Marvinbryantia formatexigens]|nr:proton-conducting transporter membrane subunit [Marvinbryantia formatexigens]UWO24854.1 sodium:proton antiporter [Marvinbryantia formatexigens DSM 14469]SDG78734.1 hydrogenase-4 component B [Marvinbryantia formatexigens]